MRYGTVTLFIWMAFGIAFYFAGRFGPGNTTLCLTAGFFGTWGAIRLAKMSDAYEWRKVRQARDAQDRYLSRSTFP